MRLAQLTWGLILSVVWMSASSQVSDIAVDDTDYGKVGYAHITGVIDRMRHRYLGRVIDDASEFELDTLIVHIDTDGGEVLHAREMFKRVLDQKREGMKMIAFVDFRAISAGGDDHLRARRKFTSQKRRPSAT